MDVAAAHSVGSGHHNVVYARQPVDERVRSLQRLVVNGQGLRKSDQHDRSSDGPRHRRQPERRGVQQQRPDSADQRRVRIQLLRT